MCAVLRIIVCVFAAALASSAAAQNDETTLAKLIRDLGQKSFAKKWSKVSGERKVRGLNRDESTTLHYLSKFG